MGGLPSYIELYPDRQSTQHVLLPCTFVPSSDFAFQLPFFDQYAQSTSVWSADGKRLVYGADSSGYRSNGSGQGEHVLVLDADGQASAAVAANGGAAVWSPPRAR